MKSKSLLLPVVALLTLVSMQVNAAVVPVSFTKLTGTLSGGGHRCFQGGSVHTSIDRSCIDNDQGHWRQRWFAWNLEWL
jgi:hypothetical protein